MSDSSFASCTTLLPLYRAWGEAFAVAKKTLKLYVVGEVDRETCHRALDEARQKRDMFVASTAKTHSFRETPCSALERLTLETMKAYLESPTNTSPPEEMLLRSDGTYIHEIELVGFNRTREDHAKALSLLPIFSELDTLAVQHMDHAELSIFPSSLRVLLLRNSPKTKQSEFTHTATLSNLPHRLEVLDLDRSSVVHLPDLPESLRTLDIRYTRISELPKKLPPHLEILYALKSDLKDLPDVLPDTLTLISVDYTPAKNNPDVITRLKAFEKKHPHANIKY